MPLFDAVYSRNIAEVKRLIEQEKADVNAPAAEPELALSRPLHLATVAGQLEIVNYLVEKGADPNTTDIKGNTPLHLATNINKITIANRLLEAGADPNTKNNEGLCPLFIATINGFI